ncbi:hypothetical protein CDD82_3282 [Ophiocordyceps australis]|uniref:PLD phosphodiesterase domain-containing protein n=1 Tax=Ophiocordyceps australis TaxID=1399860 RepID=A0A2C5ZFJ1_9HYPO|nr:hypothetical protein CDD82_3282 [Ophiocordyceps australis]
MAKSHQDLPEPNSDGEDDADIRYAIALSLQDQQSAMPQQTAAAAPEASQSLGLLGLDRKKMEEERLARLAGSKRLRSPDAIQVESGPPRKKNVAARAVSAQDTNANACKMPFTEGVVKRTWVRGYPRTGDDIKIEEVLQRQDLQLAVVSSYQWDEEWLLAKVDLHRTKMLFVAFAAHDSQKTAIRANMPSSIKFCFPEMHGPGSMHSKLQLLRFPSHLRVVVPTGNLVPYDWGETGAMENMVFLIDLPRLKDGVSFVPTPFSTELMRFVRALGLDDKMVTSLSNYDFCKTAHVGFVFSRPGSHQDESEMKRIGYCGLATAVAELGLASTAPIQIDVATASLGSIKWDWVESVYKACQGNDGIKEHGRSATGAARKSGNKRQCEWLKDRFRIYFPTNQTVTDSRGGSAAAGTICFQASWWRRPDFPTELMRDCINTRPGLLMHTKIILVHRLGLGDAKAGGWAYVGSANLSESAWGRMTTDRQTRKAKMNCRNWECGVVVPAGGKTSSDSKPVSGGTGGDDDAVADVVVFDGTVPVPMQVPARPNREPWFYAS